MRQLSWETEIGVPRWLPQQLSCELHVMVLKYFSYPNVTSAGLFRVVVRLSRNVCVQAAVFLVQFCLMVWYFQHLWVTATLVYCCAFFIKEQLPNLSQSIVEALVLPRVFWADGKQVQIYFFFKLCLYGCATFVFPCRIGWDKFMTDDTLNFFCFILQ